jgi:hypothetical protein
MSWIPNPLAGTSKARFFLPRGQREQKGPRPASLRANWGPNLAMQQHHLGDSEEQAVYGGMDR